MGLHWIDWAIIAAFLMLSLYIGIRFKNKASGSLADFFLGGRNLPWYIAGISMVATTFAADTPLWVTERIANEGISGNWLWWNMVIAGMLTTFFFARLWRRANVLTELEFIELRYGGKPASWLRGFKAVYLGVFLNSVVIGWVNFAMIKILEVFFELPFMEALFIVGGMMVFVAIYSSLSGLLGIAITDTVQFVIAMTGCVILAVIVLNHDSIGGIAGLKEQLAHESWRFDFFPRIGGDAASTVGTFSLSIGAFLSYVCVQWWASWYPGAEPGGGGYVAQRMMSAKNEKHAVLATLFFNIAHYCLRPWPWIIVGLCALVLYPDLPATESSKGFVYAMRDHLPVGLKGLLLVAFLGAYMSTISTQLNWGSSFLSNDLYKRFIRKPDTFDSEAKANKHYVASGRIFTVFIMLFAFGATTMIETIDAAVKFLIACGAGLGAVLILRWYWWRINVWSEIAATLAPFLFFSISAYLIEPRMGPEFAANNGTLFVTVIGTTITWLWVTFLTKPESMDTLQGFYDRVRPQGNWKVFKGHRSNGTTGGLLVAWLSSVVLVYSILFLIGRVIFHEWTSALMWAGIAAAAGAILAISIKRTNLLTD